MTSRLYGLQVASPLTYHNPNQYTGIFHYVSSNPRSDASNALQPKLAALNTNWTAYFSSPSEPGFATVKPLVAVARPSLSPSVTDAYAAVDTKHTATVRTNAGTLQTGAGALAGSVTAPCAAAATDIATRIVAAVSHRASPAKTPDSYTAYVAALAPAAMGWSAIAFPTKRDVSLPALQLQWAQNPHGPGCFQCTSGGCSTNRPLLVSMHVCMTSPDWPLNAAGLTGFICCFMQQATALAQAASVLEQLLAQTPVSVKATAQSTYTTFKASADTLNSSLVGKFDTFRRDQTKQTDMFDQLRYDVSRGIPTCAS